MQAGHGSNRSPPASASVMLGPSRAGQVHFAMKQVCSGNVLTADRLRELLNYDPETGVFTWLVSRSGTARSDTVAGWVKSNGYLYISVDGRIYRAHRLAWLSMNGVWPSGDIDHINCVRSDNRASNLREAKRYQNNANSRIMESNSVGLKGVTFNKQRCKYISQIQVYRNKKNLGYFDCPAAAHFAYIVAADKAFGEFARAQ
jgi:hypothetical protein